MDEKIKKLDAELLRYKEQIKRTRPGPAQEAIKARAMRILKQKKMYCFCDPASIRDSICFCGSLEVTDWHIWGL